MRIEVRVIWALHQAAIAISLFSGCLESHVMGAFHWHRSSALHRSPRQRSTPMAQFAPSGLLVAHSTGQCTLGAVAITTSTSKPKSNLI